jgi:hypothetical protein
MDPTGTGYHRAVRSVAMGAGSLARLTSPGRRSVVMDWTHDVRMNSLLKSRLKSRRSAASFCHLFCYESVSNIFDRDRPSRLRNAVTLDRSSLYICVAGTEIGIYQQPRKHQHI